MEYRTRWCSLKLPRIALVLDKVFYFRTFMQNPEKITRIKYLSERNTLSRDKIIRGIADKYSTEIPVVNLNYLLEIKSIYFRG